MDNAKLQTDGFTLIELVIALGVAAVIMGGVFISFRTVDRTALQQATYTVQADLRFTQRMAMIEGRRWGIIFDVPGNQYHIMSFDPRTVEKTIPIQNGVRLVETSDPVMLYLPRGTSSAGFRVTLANRSYYQQLTGTVSGGRIAIKEMMPIGDIPITD